VISNLLRFVGWRHVWRRPVRTALTIVGVAVGVALFVAISAINQSTLDFFRTNVGSMTGKATFTILGPEGGFAEETVEVARKVPGVKSAVPMIEAQARHVGGKTIVVFGIDLLQESAVRDYRNDKAKQEDVVEDPLEFLNQEDSIIVTKTFAKAHDLKIDSPIELVTAMGKKQFIVRGLLEPSGPAKAYGGGVAIMDIDGARVMFGKEGKVDRIDIVPAPGVDEAELAARIQAAVGSGLRVERKENQVRALSRMVEGYQGILAFFSLLALLIGMFLVANTVAVSVADRRREIAVLRALGASRPGVLVMFVVEAAIMGVVGAAIGVLVGRGLAGLLVEQVSASMSRQYVTPIDVSELHFSAAQAIGGVIAGTVAATVAALWPAWQATRVQGGEAFGAGPAGAPSARTTRRTTIFRVTGVVMLVIFGIVSAVAPPHPVLEVVKPLLGVLGAVLGAPLLVALGIRALAWIVDARGPFGRFVVLRLACQNLLRHPSRTGGNVLSLVIGLMLVVTMAVIQFSFKTSIGDWNKRTLRSDLWVSSIGRVLTIDVQPLSESIAAELDQVPGVDLGDGKGARGFRIVHFMHEGHQLVIKAYDPMHPRIGTSLIDVVDRPAKTAALELYDASHPGVIVSQNFAAKFHKKTGDTLELDTPSGHQRLRIVATATDYGSPEGVLIFARDVYKRLWLDPLVTGFSIEVAPGHTTESVRSAIDAKFGTRGLVATPNHELSKQFDEVMDESFGYTKAIEFAALAIGLLALLSTLLVSLLARQRELGMLRAIGLSRGQLARMILAEAMLLGLFGGLVAAALGVFIARLWVVSTLASSLGWFIRVHIPFASVGTTVVTGVLVGVTVGLLCAWRVASLQIRNALEST
jgi:putative ABC transport system permease protein